ncbi:hypothetical protein BGZ65_012883, partial [Modicella reniformis]
IQQQPQLHNFDNNTNNDPQLRHPEPNASSPGQDPQAQAPYPETQLVLHGCQVCRMPAHQHTLLPCEHTRPLLQMQDGHLPAHGWSRSTLRGCLLQKEAAV